MKKSKTGEKGGERYVSKVAELLSCLVYYSRIVDRVCLNFPLYFPGIQLEKMRLITDTFRNEIGFLIVSPGEISDSAV